MTEEKLGPVEPVTVTMVGTGDGSLPKSGALATTPGIQPNLIVRVIGPMTAVVIRFVNQFLTTLVGLIGAASLTPAGEILMPANDFGHLVINCAWLSVAGAGFGALKDIATIFGRLETRYPLSTGAV